MYTVVGLGNPGEEYEHTRHNAGRLAANFIEKKELPKVKVVHPDTYMNLSGKAVAKVMEGKKSERLIVIYDELDLPLGSLKISFNRSSGGHKGVESIIRALKTREFIRIRIGIASTTPTGKLKKPKGDAAVEKYILGEFKKNELEVLKKVFKTALETVETIVGEGKEAAMNRFN
jgi:peptidyl-tRNA hydrolase, PTH1 family